MTIKVGKNVKIGIFSKQNDTRIRYSHNQLNNTFDTVF